MLTHGIWDRSVSHYRLVILTRQNVTYSTVLDRSPPFRSRIRMGHQRVHEISNWWPTGIASYATVVLFHHRHHLPETSRCQHTTFVSPLLCRRLISICYRKMSHRLRRGSVVSVVHESVISAMSCHRLSDLQILNPRRVRSWLEFQFEAVISANAHCGCI